MQICHHSFIHLNSECSIFFCVSVSIILSEFTSPSFPHHSSSSLLFSLSLSHTYTLSLSFCLSYTHTLSLSLLHSLSCSACSLESCDVDWSTMPHLANVIAKSTSVTGFNLTDNSLGPRGTEVLAGHLTSSRLITFLE